MTNKKNIKQLIEPMGRCIASNQIVNDGYDVGVMYREEPDFDGDSGWRFFSGHEEEDYLGDADNFDVYDVNAIANCDEAIIAHLSKPTGAYLFRDDDEFVEDDGEDEDDYEED